MGFSFELIKTCAQTGARRGRIITPHGVIETPVFMPVGTQATVKAMAPFELEEIGTQILLANTYHLHLRPGEEIIRDAGGLHDFMDWHRPILTDSGGFQVFSLEGLRKISEEGVEFRSHIDGAKRFLSPESATAVQEALGADIIMAFDECSPYPCDRTRAEEAMHRTHRWAKRSKNAQTRDDQAMFGIVQGAFYADLRRESALTLAEMDFPGYSIGGLSVGEPKPVMYEMLELLSDVMPREKPRYLMGVGSPDCLLEGVSRGIDMFDCVLATRNARNASLLTSEGKLNMRNHCHITDLSPVDARCDCYLCTHFTRAYLHHLFRAKEILAARLATWHNLRFLTRLMEGARSAIDEDRYGDFLRENARLLE